MNIRDYGGDIARSLAFLSRIPVPSSFFEGHDGKLGETARAFPIAGLLIALPAAIIFGALLALRTDPLMAALLALAVLTVTTGALHEDGLSDTADGLGGKDRDRALAIMKDSRIGTYGAVALILSFGLRAAAIAAIGRGLPPLHAALTLPAAAVLSRGAMVWHWYALPAAKPDGVAASAGKPDYGAMQIALISALVLSAFLLWPSLRLMPFILCLFMTATAAFLFTRRVRQRLSGHTGDTIGATQQICEIAAFCALAICL
ncbi:MAG: adenosylcobinamide-GDP ribazoletransferase [Rhizobium sp.]